MKDETTDKVLAALIVFLWILATAAAVEILGNAKDVGMMAFDIWYVSTSFGVLGGYLSYRYWEKYWEDYTKELEAMLKVSINISSDLIDILDDERVKRCLYAVQSGEFGGNTEGQPDEVHESTEDVQQMSSL